MPTGELAGRRLLVVGGASGIGLAAARLAASAGAAAAVLDRNAAASGFDGPAFRADVSDRAALEAAVDAAAAVLGGLDGLLYCAGIDLVSPLAEMADADWSRVIEVNLTGAMRCCRAVLPHMPEAGGTIVLVSSAAGLLPIPDRSAYSASKAGLVMLAKSLALELAPRGIRVNALCPGAVDTPLFRGSLGSPVSASLEAVRARYALRRVAEPEELARTALFLCGPASSYVTGVALAADGGRSFH